MPLDNPAAENYENHIPAGVKRAARRAEAAAREIGATGVPELPDEEPPVEPVETPVEPPVEEAPPAPAPVEPPTDWEQRYRTLQGKYDSEVPQLRSRLTSMERLVSTMEHPQPPPVTTTVVDIPAEDREAFGEDLIAASQRWAAAKFTPELETMRREIAELKGGHQRMATQTSQQRAETGLDADKEIGGVWRGVNEDPKFIDWLNQIDPFSGEQRMRFLGEAYANGDAVRCGRFFKTFIAEHTVTDPTPTPTPAHTSAPEAGRPTLEEMAAPGRAAGHGPQGGAPAEKRVWSRNEVTAFYRDCTHGKYDHRPADKIRVEADIHAAISEGRIR